MCPLCPLAAARGHGDQLRLPLLGGGKAAGGGEESQRAPQRHATLCAFCGFAYLHLCPRAAPSDPYPCALSPRSFLLPRQQHTGVITTPLDVLKTRLMTQGASGRYKNILDATVQIARTEGMGAFMSGWQPRLIWISIGGFVFFPVLEAAKKYYAPA